MPATQDAYARAFAANARRPGALAAPGRACAATGAGRRRHLDAAAGGDERNAARAPTQGMNVAPAGSPGISMGGAPFSPAWPPSCRR